jgi:hypothetical protein
MKRTTTLASPLILSLSLLWSCHTSEEYKSVPAPESGEFCYKALKGNEYIRLSVNHGEVNGMLINRVENQPLIRDLSGKLVPDKDETNSSRIQVNLSYADVSVDQTWLADFQKDGLQVKYDVNARKFTSYKAVPCDSVSTEIQRLQETVLNYKNTSFILPKGEPLCYEATRPANGSYLLEYFQLWIIGGKVKGRGAGYYTGSPVWDFDFHGSLEKNAMLVTINYRETGEKPHSVMEKWTIDPKEQRIYIKSYPNSVLATREYVQVENKDFLNFVYSYFTKEDRVR